MCGCVLVPCDLEVERLREGLENWLSVEAIFLISPNSLIGWEDAPARISYPKRLLVAWGLDITTDEESWAMLVMRDNCF